MKKVISYILLGGIISIICYGVYSEIAYTFSLIIQMLI